MTRITAAALVATLMISGTATLASNDTVTPAMQAQVTEKLSQQGYEVRKIEHEDGALEVYAIKDGQKFELYLDGDLNVTRSKIKE